MSETQSPPHPAPPATPDATNHAGVGATQSDPAGDQGAGQAAGAAPKDGETKSLEGQSEKGNAPPESDLELERAAARSQRLADLEGKLQDEREPPAHEQDTRDVRYATQRDLDYAQELAEHQAAFILKLKQIMVRLGVGVPEMDDFESKFVAKHGPAE